MQLQIILESRFAPAAAYCNFLIDACRGCRKIIGPEIPGRNLFETKDALFNCEYSDRAARDAIRDRNRQPQA
jgi:hypothetical protein